jgi:hypothetical protein
LEKCFAGNHRPNSLKRHRGQSALIYSRSFFTQVLDGDMVKIVAWYDNEFGYSNRFVEQAIMIGKHYLDKIKFCYNSRGSLYEANNWAEILFERKIISEDKFNKFKTISYPLGVKLNNYIAAEYKAKSQE